MVLTLLLGPLGLLYASVPWGLMLIVVAVVTAGSIIGPIICWFVAILVGDHYVYKHNKNIEEVKALLSSRR